MAAIAPAAACGGTFGRGAYGGALGSAYGGAFGSAYGGAFGSAYGGALAPAAAYGGAIAPGAAYGGAGEGNVAIIGELPVAGNTAVAGTVPHLRCCELLRRCASCWCRVYLRTMRVRLWLSSLLLMHLLNMNDHK